MRYLPFLLKLLLAGWLALCLAPKARAAADDKDFKTDSRPAGPRMALLIGNGAYSEKIGKLAYPRNDVRLMEQLLQEAGFRAVTLHDASQAAMRKTLRDFGERAKGASVALVFYSGHGTQVDGENYLVPLLAEEPADEVDLRTRSTSGPTLCRRTRCSSGCRGRGARCGY